jgi:hypothetical protein
VRKHHLRFHWAERREASPDRGCRLHAQLLPDDRTRKGYEGVIGELKLDGPDQTNERRHAWVARGKVDSSLGVGFMD